MNRFEPSLLDKLFGDGRNQPASAAVRQLSLDELNRLNRKAKKSSRFAVGDSSTSRAKAMW